MTSIDYYFDYGCPWCYIADFRLRDVALRNGARIDWRPVSLSQVLAAAGRRLSDLSLDAGTPRGRYELQDLADWSSYWGLSLTCNLTAGPQDVDAAACGAVVALEEGCIESYSEAVYAARYGVGQDVGSAERLGEIASSLGLDAGAFVERLGSEAVQRRIEEYSDQLVERGGFGVPTLFIGDAMYFGNDRMPLVEWALSPVSGEDFVAPGAHGQA